MNGRHQTRSAAPFSTREQAYDVFSLSRMLLLYAVLFKYSEIRFWPHAYAGEMYAPSRIVYYAEFGVTLCTFAMVAIHINYIWDFMRNNYLMMVFLLYALIVTLIYSSSAIVDTLQILSYFEIVLALYLVVAIDGAKLFFRIFLNSATIFLAINFLSLAIPSQSLMIGEFSGFFRGMTAHRNNLSQISVVYFAVSLWGGRNITGTQRIINIGLALLMIVLARSVQGVVLAMLIFYLKFAFSLPMSVRKTIFLISGSVAIIMSILLMSPPQFIEDMFEFFGRDTSFTGRDRIWSLSLYLISVMPLQGYGLWAIGSDILDTALLREYGLGTLFGTAHNAYLEAILSFGWIGGGLFLIICALSFITMVKIFWSSRNDYRNFAGIMIFISLLGGVTASEKLFLPGFGWLTFVAALTIAKCGRKTGQ